MSSDAPRILVLEDDHDMRRILTTVLEGQGYLVTAVESGLAAVEEAAKQDFALIVADIRMEGMDGLEALAKTKSYQPEIGSLVVSGYSTPEDTERAAALGVGAYLKKPFRMQRFLEAVRAQLGKVSREEQARASSSAADEAFIWALSEHIDTVDQEGLFAEPGTLADIRVSGRALAQHIGFDEAACKQIGLAAQLIRLRDSSFSQPPDWLLKQEEMVSPLSRALTVPNSKESQAAHLAAHAQSSLETEIQPEILTAFQNLEIHSEAGEADPAQGGTPRRGGSLLILGRALAQSGDKTNAQAAYDKALELAESTDERVKVRLETLEFRLKDSSANMDFLEECQELLSLEAELGPFAAAKLALEVGLIQRRAGASEDAKVNLERAAQHLERLGQETLEAVARVALHQSGEAQQRLNTVVPRLLHPSGLDELTDRAHWLVPAIAESNVDSTQMKSLLLRVPQVLAYALRQSSVSLAGRQRILASLLDLPKSPQVLVDALQKDSEPEIRSKAAQLTSSPEAQSRPLVRLYTFGGFEAYVGEELISPKAWKTQKTMYLVAYIANHGPRGPLEEHTIDIFWPTSGTKGKKNINWALSMARGCMRGDGNFNPILRQSGRLNFNELQPVWHDMSEFKQALKESRQASGRKLALNLAQLQRLYRGPYLEGCYLDWAVRLRDEAEREAGEAFMHMAQEFYGSSLFDEAAEAARASLKSAPLNQEGHLILMRAETKRGRPVNAIEQFQVCKKMLAAEYGIEPGMELVKAELEARMAQG